MFCDLVGSTPLSEQLDAEDWAAVVIAYQTACREVITELGGYVAQYQGDGILAYFGYPEAHEHDPERATRAGLEVLRKLSELNRSLVAETGVRLAVRIGIHTGPVVVGDIGDQLRPERMIFGDTPNLAARVQTAAEPNSVLITEATYRLLRAPFVTRDRGLQELKGVSRAVHLITVMEPSHVESLDRPWGHGPLVGRDAEMGLLRDSWREVRQGQWRAVAIRGEAGVGKSRLVGELRHQLADEPHFWLEGHCSPLFTSTPFYPLMELLREATTFAEGESRELSLGKLTSALQSAGLVAEETLPVIAPLVGLALDEQGGPISESPELQRRRTMETLVGWELAQANPGPLVFCIEDLHWSDPSTLVSLSLLLDRIEGSRLLCLFTHRPEFVLPLTGPSVLAIPLERLSLDESKQLAQAVASDIGVASSAPLPPVVLDQLADRADGNPLYVEELVKTMAEAGDLSRRTLDEQSIPATLRDSLTARLDRLGPARRVAQLAAMLGREFSLPLLAAVADMEESALQAELDVLVQAAILEPRIIATEKSYQFHHALIQEAAYYSLLRRERSRLHASIASVLEDRFPQSVEREPEVLALHLRRAGEAARAAELYLRAGRRAVGQAAVHEAVAHYREGLATLEEHVSFPGRDRLELSLQILLGNALMVDRGFGAPETLPVWTRASVLAEELGDVDELTSALNGAAVYYYDSGDSSAAVEQAGRILRLAEEHGLRIAALRGHCTMALALLYRGQVQEALEHAQAARSLYKPSDFDLVTYGVGTDQGVVAHGTASLALWWLGRPRQALAEASAGVALAQRLESSLSLAMARTFLAITHHLRREPEDALRVAQENIEFSQRLGFPFWLGLGLMLAGAQQARLTGDPAGLEEVYRGLSILGDTGSRGGAALGFAILAEAQRCVGDLDAALGTLEAGLGLVTALGDRFNDGELLRMKAEVLVARDHAAGPEASKILTSLVTHSRERGALVVALRSAVSLVRLDGAVTSVARGLELLQGIYGQFTEGFETPDLRDAAGLLRQSGLAVEGAR